MSWIEKLKLKRDVYKLKTEIYILSVKAKYSHYKLRFYQGWIAVLLWIWPTLEYEGGQNE